MVNLFVFNPSSEMAIANGGNGYTPHGNIKLFEQNLEVLPFIFSRLSNDIVVVDACPDIYWVEYMRNIRGKMPRFMTFKEVCKQIKSKSANISKCSPWGWNQRILKILEPVLQYLPDKEIQLPNYGWNSQYKEVYGRQTSLKVLTLILNNSLQKEILLPEVLKPTCVTTLKDANDLVNKFVKAVLKTPYSSSGRGIMMLENNKIDMSSNNWILSNIRKFGFIMLEPYLNKKLDLSAQFFLSKSKCKFVGFSSTLVNQKGGYAGNFVRRVRVPTSIFDFLHSIDLKSIVDEISNAVLSQKIDHYYNGYFGVDMMICENETGAYFIQPCVEINLRYNMGILSHFLGNLVSPASYGLFKIVSTVHCQEGRYGLKLTNKNLLFDDSKIVQGRLHLSPITNKKYVAILDVGKLDETSFELGAPIN